MKAWNRLSSPFARCPRMLIARPDCRIRKERRRQAPPPLPFPRGTLVSIVFARIVLGERLGGRSLAGLALVVAATLALAIL